MEEGAGGSSRIVRADAPFGRPDGGIGWGSSWVTICGMRWFSCQFRVVGLSEASFESGLSVKISNLQKYTNL